MARWTKVQLERRAAPARLESCDKEASMTSVPVIARCLTCKNALPAGVEAYCDEACRLKVTRGHRAPGRTAARRRRRRGGRRR